MRDKQQQDFKMVLESGLLAVVKQEVESAEYRRLKEHIRTSPHPTSAQLYDYVSDELDGQEARKVRRHQVFCEACAEEVSAIMRMDDKTEKRVQKWAGSMTDGKSSLRDTLIEWLSPLWEPLWAGQPVTAADVAAQQHTFTLEDGDITLSCTWKTPYQDEPASILITWKADLFTENELWIGFVNPETQAVRYRACLGTRRTGEERFTCDELGFEPSEERWAMTLGLREM